MLFQLVIIMAGYVVGIAMILVLKLVGITFIFSKAVMLILILPLVSVCITEAFTLLWSNTPGSVGLGGLFVFIPMIIAGFLSGTVAFVAQKWMLPLELGSSVRKSENLTIWLVLLISCCVITLSLWRFWPAPTAKLW